MASKPARPQPSRDARLQALAASAVRRRSGRYVPPGIDEGPAPAPPGSAEERAQAMMLCAPTAQDLELPEPTLEGIVEALRSIPFEPAMLACSLVAGILFHHPRDRGRHLALSAELHQPWLAQRMRGFLAAAESHVGFDQRHVAALQRLLVTHAAPDPEEGPTRGMTEDEVEQIMLGLIGLASVLPQLEPPDDPRTPDGGLDPTQIDWAGWASYTVRVGAWYDEPYIADAMARAHAFYVDVHGSAELGGHAARCDVERWVTDDTGLTLAQQLAGALACAIKTAVLSPTATIDERAKYIEPGFLSQGAMADLEPRLRQAISATRSELVAMLDAGGQDPVRIAWDHMLVEVYAGRVALAARAGADGELMLKAIDNATTAKLVELADRTRELLKGDFTYPDLDLGRIQRIWPVIVLAGDPILQTQALWAHLRQRAPHAFLKDARVERPIVLDLDDLDPMLAQIERGAVLPELLAEFMGSAYAELPPRNWMKERFPGSLGRRPSYVREQYEAAARVAARALYPDSEDKIEIHDRDWS